MTEQVKNTIEVMSSAMSLFTFDYALTKGCELSHKHALLVRCSEVTRCDKSLGMELMDGFIRSIVAGRLG